MAARKTVTIDATKLESLVADTFAKAGCSKAEAARIGKYLTIANLTGHDSHGVQRVPRYLETLAQGLIIADQKLKVITDTPTNRMPRKMKGSTLVCKPFPPALPIATTTPKG